MHYLLLGIYAIIRKAFAWLLPAIGSIIAKGLGWGLGGILSWLGITFITYKGMQSLVDMLYDKVISQFDNMPSAMVSLMAILKIDTAIAIIFSAYVTRLAIQGFLNGFRSISLNSTDRGAS